MPPTRGRRPSAIKAPCPGCPVSPAMVTAPSHPENPSPVLARKSFEDPMTYANRIYATELLRPAQEVECDALRSLHDTQIKELKGLVGKLSEPQRDELLKRYELEMGATLRVLKKEKLKVQAWEVIGGIMWALVAFGVWLQTEDVKTAVQVWIGVPMIVAVVIAVVVTLYRVGRALDTRGRRVLRALEMSDA